MLEGLSECEVPDCFVSTLPVPIDGGGQRKGEHLELALGLDEIARAQQDMERPKGEREHSGSEPLLVVGRL